VAVVEIVVTTQVLHRQVALAVEVDTEMDLQLPQDQELELV
jgi:hypothetical protein